MTESYIVPVRSTHMLSIFSGVDIEHPYRFQPYIRFVICIDEYRMFVNSMVGLSISWLNFDTAYYAKALSEENDNLLIKLYYYDLSKAIISELMLSVANGAEGTVMIHNFPCKCSKELCIEHICNELFDYPKEKIKKAAASLIKEAAGYFDISALTNHNLLLFRYALLLRVLSYTENPSRFNII